MRIPRRSFAALAALLLAAACGAPAPKSEPAPSPAADPVAAIEPLYAPYVENKNIPGLLESAPWTDEVRGLLQQAMDRSNALNEPLPVVDFDPIVDAQDWQITEMRASLKTPPADGRAQVTVQFKNFGQDVALTYDLKEEGGGWRVDNITGANWNLRQLIADSGAPVAQ